MKHKDGGGGGGGASPRGTAAVSTTRRGKKQKGRLYTLTTGPLPQPKFNAIVAAIHARKKTEETALREQIVANARRAQEEAWRAAPTVLESGLDALEDFDASGRPRPDKGSTSGIGATTSTAAAAGEAQEGKQQEGEAAALSAKGQEERKEEGEGGGEGQPARKRQKTMADVVQLHRKLADLQKTRTELRWLMEQVERLEYEAL